MKLFHLCAATVGLLFLTAQVATAAEVSVIQKDRKFSEKKITIKVGDSIAFANDDDITHNVHSLSKGFEFDVGAQKPGTKIVQKFDKVGKFKVRCAIHPKMKINVVVE